MSNWKVSKEIIEMFPHYNADLLQVGKVGQYQVVVQKGLYETGDVVVFAPEKSVLTGRIKEEFEKYLGGPNKDKVHPVTLRGEYSCGIIIPPELLPNVDEFEIGEDISAHLGISKYIPTIPDELKGAVEVIEGTEMTHKHDCVHYAAYANDFVEGERVIGTEKIHGTQVVIYSSPTVKFVSSKGLFDEGLKFKDDTSNVYTRAVANTNLFEKIAQCYNGEIVQITGEAFPANKGFGYGQTEPTLRVFDVKVDGVSVPYNQVAGVLKELWVPVLFDGELDAGNLREFANGKEQVSGKELHIREGIVVRPYIDRKGKDGTWLKCKILNKKYKETGEELS
jgi:RNA ligase (TIGR02306 family)